MPLRSSRPIGLLTALLMLVAAAAGAQQTDVLYRFRIVQAAPGRLVELISTVQKHAPIVAAGGDEVPVVIRHSQGDHWDLRGRLPDGRLERLLQPARVARREAAAKAAGAAPARGRATALTRWCRGTRISTCEGPPVEALRAHVKDAGLLHFEMMQALPGKRDTLVEERRMENAFNRDAGPRRDADLRARPGRGVGRRHARRLPQLASIRGERDDPAGGVAMPPRRRPASRAPTRVGPYMRTLISTHRDTLGPPVKVKVEK